MYRTFTSARRSLLALALGPVPLLGVFQAEAAVFDVCTAAEF